MPGILVVIYAHEPHLSYCRQRAHPQGHVNSGSFGDVHGTRELKSMGKVSHVKQCCCREEQTPFTGACHCIDKLRSHVPLMTLIHVATIRSGRSMTPPWNVSRGDCLPRDGPFSLYRIPSWFGNTNESSSSVLTFYNSLVQHLLPGSNVSETLRCVFPRSESCVFSSLSDDRERVIVTSQYPNDVF